MIPALDRQGRIARAPHPILAVAIRTGGGGAGRGAGGGASATVGRGDAWRNARFLALLFAVIVRVVLLVLRDGFT